MITMGTCAISSDHAGFEMKKEVLTWLKDTFSALDIRDMGPLTEASVDYPDYVHPLARDVDSGILERAILLCGSGNGVAMTANKYDHVRAALCWTPEIARLARMHNDANVLCIPARFIEKEDVFQMIREFLTTEFEGGRHERRVEKIVPKR